jgi:hypothetical protein
MNTENHISQLNHATGKINLARNYIYANEIEKAYNNVILAGRILHLLSKELEPQARIILDKDRKKILYKENQE